MVAPFGSRIPIEVKVLIGTVFLEIIREVLHCGHDLAIKAPEEPAWLERVFGSDDMHLLRKCPCPVWLVKHSASKSYRRVLAAVDVDHPAPELAIRHKLNVKILEVAVSLALSDFAELLVAHAWEAVAESAVRSAFLRWSDAEVGVYKEMLRQQHDEGLGGLLNEVIETQGGEDLRYLNLKKHLIKVPPRAEFPALADMLRADFVVMGTVARTGVAGLFIGNTAETILEQIESSLLAVKPEGFKTPVSLEGHSA